MRHKTHPPQSDIQVMKTKYPEIKRFLDKPFWLPTLDPHAAYEREPDGADDTGDRRVTVSFGPKGEACLTIGNAEPVCFQNYMEHGASLRTHAALMVLAEAIRLDNVDRPQTKPAPRTGPAATSRRGPGAAPKAT